MNADIRIRNADPADAGELLGIYAPYVQNTAVTFEYETPSPEEFAGRIRAVSSRYPYLIAVFDGRIAGYAYASSFKGRSAYDWSVETSIYVDRECHGQGIGTLLYNRLEELLKRQNVCNLCACIAYPNPESISFHERMGYQTVAHFHKSGYKFNTWYDMIWMEKFINEHTAEMKPFIPYSEMESL